MENVKNSISGGLVVTGERGKQRETWIEGGGVFFLCFTWRGLPRHHGEGTCRKEGGASQSKSLSDEKAVGPGNAGDVGNELLAR